MKLYIATYISSHTDTAAAMHGNGSINKFCMHKPSGNNYYNCTHLPSSPPLYLITTFESESTEKAAWSNLPILYPVAPASWQPYMHVHLL